MASTPAATLVGYPRLSCLWASLPGNGRVKPFSRSILPRDRQAALPCRQADLNSGLYPLLALLLLLSSGLFFVFSFSFSFFGLDPSSVTAASARPY